MGIFSNISKAYKIFKENKDICCENMHNALDQMNISIQESCKEKQLELLEKYNEMYEEYKENFFQDKKCIDSDALLEYMNGKLSKDEYELRNIFFKELVQQSINDVEQGKISHKEFFERIHKKDN